MHIDDEAANRDIVFENVKAARSASFDIVRNIASNCAGNRVFLTGGINIGSDKTWGAVFVIDTDDREWKVAGGKAL